MCQTIVLFVCHTIVLVCTISLKLYLPHHGGEESPWTTASHWRLELFSAPFIYPRSTILAFTYRFS